LLGRVFCPPAALRALVFLPVGRYGWMPGWIFIGFGDEALSADTESRALQTPALC